MKNTEYIEILKEREKDLQEELNLVRRLLGNVSPQDNESSDEVEKTDDSFPVVIRNKNRSAVARVRNAVKKLLAHKVSLQIDDIRANLDRMGVEYNKSAIHNAFNVMRDNDELISYKINNSNHMVYYMHPDGRDDSLTEFPVKPEYRPKNISESEVNEIDFREE